MPTPSFVICNFNEPNLHLNSSNCNSLLVEAFVCHMVYNFQKGSCLSLTSVSLEIFKIFCSEKVTGHKRFLSLQSCCVLIFWWPVSMN